MLPTSEQYIIFKTGQPLMQPGYIERLGSYLGYVIGYIPDEYMDNRIQITSYGAEVLDKDVALAWPFLDCYSGELSLKIGTTLRDAFADLLTSMEQRKEKVKYVLTDENKANAITLHKAIMQKFISDRFNERRIELQLGVSDLEKETWPHQKKEADEHKKDSNANTPVLDILAQGKGITTAELATRVTEKSEEYVLAHVTMLVEEQSLQAEVKACATLEDCWRIRHTYFGMSMGPVQIAEEEIEESPLSLKVTF